MKDLYRGAFSYSCEAHILYAYAHSKEQARVFMCRRLAEKHDVHPAMVLNMFDGSKPNYEITIETEMEESDEV